MLFRSIMEISDFTHMLNRALGISTHQLSYVTNASEGEGLMFYGSTIIPFIDRFPKDTVLYDIMTTKPSEVRDVGLVG